MRDAGDGRWPYREYCDAVESEVGRFVDVVTGVESGTAVPTCPGWTIADLVEHHGSSHRRVAYVVGRRSRERVLSKDVPGELPDDPAGYPAWLAEGAGVLVATLRAADPDAPVWTNGVDQSVRYWARRILFEAVIHRADAEIAVGQAPTIDPRTGTDGVDELLTNLPCFPWVAERLRDLRRPGDALHLHATDRDGEWLISLGRDGFTWQRRHAPATVAVHGATGDLLLLAYGRIAANDDRVTVTGDVRLLEQWLEKSAL